MVRFLPEDPESPVQLFHQQEAGYGVGERHPREREPAVAPRKDRRREPKIPADYKRELILSGEFLFAKPNRQLLTRPVLPVNVKGDDKIPFREYRKDPLSFLICSKGRN